MVRVFALLVNDAAVISDDSIFQDVSETVIAAWMNECNDTIWIIGLSQPVFQRAHRKLVDEYSHDKHNENLCKR